ncbi:predicted protein [Postia placenta Mad-698-R]|uniref:Uncharacterized protein n=1 Tax=Postia placenta MAD-698-R-SB12 TaxID=670580 RepID=A0A1X6MTW2_9APHY|nr:hypothetical protein POSPLADRAFT_1149129 [Postia placenta MAD-698-R-SB12]EED79438.1 predicted protein [Postia placenta Mad-698-R]OSX59666.1 hypothetical protein POSPLADRAFT_1149129 [Postia placenta MAD-698-R-SB12]
MSSDIAEEVLNILDAAADAATIVSASKPAARLIMNMLPSTRLKRGDQYQESTLRLLEASRKIMSPAVFEEHFHKFENICDTRETLVADDIVQSIKIRGAIKKYKKRAKTLHESMTVSSQQARRAALRYLHEAASSNNDAVSKMDALMLQEETYRGADSHDEDAQSMDITEERSVYCPTASTLTLNDPFRETASVVVQDPHDVSIFRCNVWEDDDDAQTSGRTTPTS